MRTVPPSPAPRSVAGWLSRRALLSIALWAVLLGASLGAAFAMWRAWDRIQANRFVELRFYRTTFLYLEEAADHGALRGALTALWFLIGALVVCAYAPVRRLLEPREFHAMLQSSERLLRAQAAIGLAFLAAIFASNATGEGLKRAEVYLLGLLALLGICGLAWLARRARRAQASDPRAQTNAFAAFAGLAVIVVLGFLVDRARIWKPFAPQTLVANACLLAGAVATFLLVRRSLLFGPRADGRGPLGGLGTRLALLAVVLPALSPLALRGAARAWGHSILEPEPELNVVLIGLDTLRADCVDLTPPAPGQRDRTPNLRKLAERGVRFPQAISQSPWTMPSFATIMTGKYPLEHGAVSLTGMLREHEITLAEILREAGYETGSFVSNEYTDRQHGFAQGNAEFDDSLTLGPESITSQGITNYAIDFVERHAKRPFFVFAHYLDPHYKYLDHAGWDWADGYDGWWKHQYDHDNLVRNRNLIEAADMKWLRDQYDEEIAYTDREVGRLLQALEQAGVLDRTLIVVVADHGEEFLDHGNLSHTTTLYEELVHVPLIVVPPLHSPLAGTVHTEVVETRSVFTTVLESVGLDFGFRTRPRSLLAAPAGAPNPAAPPAGEPPAPAETGYAFSMVWLPDANPRWGKQFQIVSLRTARWKLIHDVTRGRYQLFDVVADPLEKNDLAGKPSEDLGQLQEVLDAWLAGQKASAGNVPTLEVDEALRERLRQLGYIS
jgi:arylsulfatase A-like enzyme